MYSYIKLLYYWHFPSFGTPDIKHFDAWYSNVYSEVKKAGYDFVDREDANKAFNNGTVDKKYATTLIDFYDVVFGRNPNSGI